MCIYMHRVWRMYIRGFKESEPIILSVLLRLCVLCAQLDAFECLICKTAKSKTITAVHLSSVKSVQTNLTITAN